VIGLPEIKLIEINNSNIDSFVSSDYKRRVRDTGVSRLHGALIAGDLLKNPLHVVGRDEKYVIIDGNHRIDAIRRFIKNGHDGVKVHIAIYKNISESEEKELYDSLAATVTQTLNDFIKIHFDEIPLIKMIEKNFPIEVNIYSRKNGILYSWVLRLIMSMYKDAPASFKKHSILETAKVWGVDEYTKLQRFFMIYKKCFGEPEASSPYYKFGTIWITASIFFRNNDAVKENALWELFEKKIVGNRFIIEASKTNNREVLTEYRAHLLQQLNRNWRGTRLV
jgi:hypothetical protein